MAQHDRNAGTGGAPERGRHAGPEAAPGQHGRARDAAAEAIPPPRPAPEPEEAPELLGERSDYPLPRGGE